VLAGATIVASSLDVDVMAVRVRDYRPADLDELCTSGEVVWVGAGSIGSNDGRVRLCFADQLRLLAPTWERPDPPAGTLHDALRAHLEQRGASFWGQLRIAAPMATDAELLAALWDLVWAGEVTNDSLAPLRALVGGGGPRSSSTPARGARRRPARLNRLGPPAGAGRWSLVAPLLEPAPRPTEALHATAQQLLERQGVVTREAVLAEGVAGGYAGVYGVLKVLEERGQARRGYFVDGLGAAQFSVAGAVDRLRACRIDPVGDGEPTGQLLVLAATDPAQPFGAVLPWPATSGRPARSAGALVVLADGAPIAWYDRRSHHLVTFPTTADHPDWAVALARLVDDRRLRSAEVRKVDGGPVAEHPWVLAACREAGWAEGYRGPVFRR
jgi:ATP-dependent helicase Lhr and Lhr-like helicase